MDRRRRALNLEAEHKQLQKGSTAGHASAKRSRGVAIRRVGPRRIVELVRLTQTSIALLQSTARERQEDPAPVLARTARRDPCTRQVVASITAQLDLGVSRARS